MSYFDQLCICGAVMELVLIRDGTSKTSSHSIFWCHYCGRIVMITDDNSPKALDWKAPELLFKTKM